MIDEDHDHSHDEGWTGHREEGEVGQQREVGNLKVDNGKNYIFKVCYLT